MCKPFSGWDNMQTRITSTASATTPITYNFYLRKLRFLRKVRKSMSFKMSLNSHNSLFAHIFFSSHFIRCQRLKEQCASSYGLPVNTFSALLKSPQKSIPTYFLPENQSSCLNYAEWHYYILRAVSAVIAVFKTAKTAITAHTCSTFISLLVFLSRGRNRFRGVAFRVGGKSQTLFRLSR